MWTGIGRRAGAGLVAAMVLGAGVAMGQAAAGVSDQDTHFLKEIDQDSNYEIETAKLALKKSASADIKQYATMLIHDHTQLKQQIKTADGVAKVTPVSATSMSLSDKASFEKLKLMKGDSFDKAYIKGLVKGNEAIQKDEKSEAADSSVPAVKKLATHSAAMDTKHADKAKQLAQAHGVQE